MHLESREILQIDATIITGILILLSVTSVIPELAKVASYVGDPSIAGNAKTHASVVIFAFSLSALVELTKMIYPFETQKYGRFRRYIYQYLSILFMMAGFIELAFFGFALWLGIRIG